MIRGATSRQARGNPRPSIFLTNFVHDMTVQQFIHFDQCNPKLCMLQCKRNKYGYVSLNKTRITSSRDCINLFPP